MKAPVLGDAVVHGPLLVSERPQPRRPMEPRSRSRRSWESELLKPFPSHPPSRRAHSARAARSRAYTGSNLFLRLEVRARWSTSSRIRSAPAETKGDEAAARLLDAERGHGDAQPHPLPGARRKRRRLPRPVYERRQRPAERPRRDRARLPRFDRHPGADPPGGLRHDRRLLACRPAGADPAQRLRRPPRVRGPRARHAAAGRGIPARLRQRAALCADGLCTP